MRGDKTRPRKGGEEGGIVLRAVGGEGASEREAPSWWFSHSGRLCCVCVADNVRPKGCYGSNKEVADYVLAFNTHSTGVAASNTAPICKTCPAATYSDTPGGPCQSCPAGEAEENPTHNRPLSPSPPPRKTCVPRFGNRPFVNFPGMFGSGKNVPSTPEVQHPQASCFVLSTTFGLGVLFFEGGVVQDVSFFSLFPLKLPLPPPTGSFCPEGSTSPTACPAGTSDPFHAPANCPPSISQF